MAEKSFPRKVIESLALKIILFFAGLVGAALLAWYTANSAWLHGVPGYKIGLLIAGVFALSWIGIYFLMLTIARIPLRNAPAGSFLEPQENWLREIAERDRLELYTCVYVTDCDVSESLHSHSSVVFDFLIRNGTVFSITVDPEVKGFISICGLKLTGEITASRLPHNLPRGMGDRFKIRQELSLSEAERILELDEPSHYYDFSNLNITIRGYSPSGDAIPARLQFKGVSKQFRRTEVDWI